MRKVTLKDGVEVSAIGQGTWRMGEDVQKALLEVSALRAGVDAGMTLIDTAEMYAEGEAERVVGRAIAGLDRGKLFLVSKVYPHNATRARIQKSLEASLERLKTDYLDLYLLHWRGGSHLAEVVDLMEGFVSEGKILRWGVSNFDADDIEELCALPKGGNCAVNQVLYHVASRGIEFDLVPAMRRRGMPLMAYSPLAQAGNLRRGIMAHSALEKIAHERGITVAQLMLAFVVRDGGTIAIPKAASEEHAMENARAADIELTAEDMAAVDAAFPPPRHKMPLDVS